MPPTIKNAANEKWYFVVHDPFFVQFLIHYSRPLLTCVLQFECHNCSRQCWVYLCRDNAIVNVYTCINFPTKYKIFILGKVWMTFIMNLAPFWRWRIFKYTTVRPICAPSCTLFNRWYLIFFQTRTTDISRL